MLHRSDSKCDLYDGKNSWLRCKIVRWFITGMEPDGRAADGVDQEVVDLYVPTPKYQDVDEMVASLPREERALMNRLRALVKECIPKAEEKAYYDWAVPFYKRNRLICFIWPQPSKGVTLGFQYGNLMSNEDGALLAEGRKQVYVMYIKSMQELDEKKVKALLFEAAMIDENSTSKPRKSFRSKKPL